MRVVVPAVPGKLHPSVVPAIVAQGVECCVAVMTDDESYYRLLQLLWHQAVAYGDPSNHWDIVVVEHDIEIPAGAIAGFRDCDRLWCSHSYEVFAGDVATAYGGPWALGLTRFSNELCRAEPDLMDAVGEMNIVEGWAPRTYGVLDACVSQQLRGRGYDAHQHHPNATHHHVYQREGVWAP